MAAAAEMSLTETKFARKCQIGTKWRVKEEDLRNIQDGFLQSKHFYSNIPGVKYGLRLYPNGRNENERNQVRAYLHLFFETTKSINATFSISVKSASIENVFEYNYDKCIGWGSQLCTRNNLFDPAKKCFVDGIMEIELEGTLSPRGIKRKASEPLTSLASVLWENDEDKGLIISVEEEEIKIHKWILCAKSPVFKAELQSEFKEAKEKKIKIIDFAAETVQIFIEYCYERDIKEQINERNASGLLHFTDKYDIKPMHDLIQNELIEKISEANVVQFANMSVTSNAENLLEFCVCFLADAAKQSIVINDVEKLNDEAAAKVCRRSLLSTS